MTYLSKKLFYEFPFHYKAKSSFEKRSDYYVALERSIAYPEGGGQLGDKGEIVFQEHSFPFFETNKVAGRGRTVIRSDFPVINVEGEVQIKLAPEHYDILPETGDVTVIVDNIFRSSLSISHTISHLVYLAMTQLRASVPENTQGCLITAEGGRFDVYVEKFLPDDLVFIKKYVNEQLQKNKEIKMTAIKDEPECRIWHYDSHSIPCGGTHMDILYQAATVEVKRKGKSRGLERIYYELQNLNVSPFQAKFKEEVL